MKTLFPLFLAAALSSCASNPSSIAPVDVNGDGVISPSEDAQRHKQHDVGNGSGGNVSKTIRNTASTLSIVRSIQAILGGF